MRIEELLSKRQQSELVTAIKGRGEVPMKLQYLGEGAKNWDKIAKARSGGIKGGINTLEEQIFKEKGKYFIDRIKGKEVNLIDMGCGNGEPVIPIIQELQRQKIKFRYVPMDISSTMIDLATRNLKSKFGDLKVHPIQMDFELGNFPDKIYELSEDGSTNLLMFLGSTLGNMADVSRVLTNVRDSMTSNDFFLIGMQFVNYSKISLIMSHYSQKEVGDFFDNILGGIGIGHNDKNWEPTWNEHKSQVEFRTKLLKDVKVHIGRENFDLDKGEVLSLGKSLKFTEANFISMLQDAGFRTEIFTTNQDLSYAMIMVQPTRYAKT